MRTSPASPALGSLLVLLALLPACVAPRAPSTQATAGDETSVRQCARGETTRGIDVSYYQGKIDWRAARQQGIAFAFARTGDGAGFVDPAFGTNWAGMRAAGVVRGAYQFFRPTDDPVAQADALVGQIREQGGLLPGDIPPALDIEVDDGVPGPLLRARVQAWLDRVEGALGRTPLVYTAPGFWSGLGAGTSFGRYPLWVANWQASCPALPSSWGAWKFWQGESSAAAAGVEGPVDLDVFDGSLADLLAFTGTDPVEPPRPTPPRTASAEPPLPRRAGRVVKMPPPRRKDERLARLAHAASSAVDRALRAIPDGW